jgi:uncharacterized protein YdaU (DUF1376 family)
MSSALPYMQFYVADYLADTAHLTTIEHGAYLLLLMNYWQRGAGLPDDDTKLARIARLSLKDWTKIRATIADLFQIEDGQWRHKRVERELNHTLNRVEQMRRAGRASAKRRLNIRSTNSPTSVEHPLDKRSEIPEQNRTEEKGSASAEPRPGALEESLREASGWQREPHPGLAVIGPIQALLDAGADLNLDVLPVVRAHAPNVRTRSGWKYFVGPIQDAVASRRSAGTIPTRSKGKSTNASAYNIRDSIDEALQFRRWAEDSQESGRERDGDDLAVVS